MNSSNTFPPAADCIIVTAADSGYFPFAKDMIDSVVASGRTDFSMGMLDLGLTPEQCAWLLERGVAVRSPLTLLDLQSLAPEDRSKLGYLARPFLRENYPGHEVYVWLDADTWLQEASALDELVAGARAVGAAVITQTDSAYRFWPWLVGWKLKHFVKGYGAMAGLWLGSRPHINNGVFAMSASAPHWDHWRHRYQKAIDRTSIPAPHDQFGLNAAVYLDRLPTRFLSAGFNWICDLSAPMWNAEARRFCKPYVPHESIGVLHLAGAAKFEEFDVRTTFGKTRRSKLRYEDVHGWANEAVI